MQPVYTLAAVPRDRQSVGGLQHNVQAMVINPFTKFAQQVPAGYAVRSAACAAPAALW